ncbi:Rpn family recombination-promoting nuclease/putative transposase [Thiocapsa rosea]|uniref:Putative YhgA-like transposase n=1 Tax=Thiocapsa rosea TaxID=69360 RepID=A0A495VBF6_9GAMM|nr:Rpn family recombination-promoting nuclease/putative transposase [Thiocapsa rosea]RKT46604.1 putative YhgA-like transposase [Thiocapsa rosea]
MSTAVRIANYATLLYQDLIAQGALSRSGRLPPVLPIVLYNGEPRWTAQTELFSLIEPVPGGLERYRPQWSYLLLDEGAIARDDAYPPEVRNLVAALFRLEKARDEATWLAVYARLVELLDSSALDSLKRAFGRWIYRSFIRKKRTGIQLPSIDDFNEVHVMLQQRVEQWNAEILERGRQEGRRETALELIRKTDFDNATIADISKLPLDEIQALRDLPSAH